MLVLETLKAEANNQPLTPTMPLPLLLWEQICNGIVAQTLNNRCPAGVLKFRSLLNDLLKAKIPADQILEKIFLLLLEQPTVSSSDKKVFALAEAAGKYGHYVAVGSKAFFHLDAFILEVMVLLEN